MADFEPDVAVTTTLQSLYVGQILFILAPPCGVPEIEPGSKGALPRGP